MSDQIPIRSSHDASSDGVSGEKSIDANDRDGSTPLALAAALGNLAAVEARLAAGADLERVGTLMADEFDPAPAPPLYRAARESHANVVTRLLTAGARTDWTDKHGQTAADVAKRFGHTAAVEALAAVGGAVNPASPGVFVAAAWAGDDDAVRRLLDAGASVDAKNKGFEGGRWQPLHFAANKGRAEVVRLLLDHGAKVRAKAADKSTPLHLAAGAGDAETVRLLLASGADPHAKDQDDQTPAAVMKYGKKRSKTIAALLHEAEKTTPHEPRKAKKVKKVSSALPRDWEAAEWDIERPDFTEAAKSAAFARAVALVAAALGVEPTTHTDWPGASRYQTTLAAATDLLDARRGELAALGAGGFAIRPFMGRTDQDAAFMLVPSADWADAVAFVQVADPNGGSGPGQIVAGLRQLYALRPFVLHEPAHDTVAGRFLAPARRSGALAKWMEAFCPDIVSQGVGSVAELARQLKTSDQLFFWWD